MKCQCFVLVVGSAIQLGAILLAGFPCGNIISTLRRGHCCGVVVVVVKCVVCNSTSGPL